MNTVFKSENYRLRKSKELWIMALILVGFQAVGAILGIVMANIGSLVGDAGGAGAAESFVESFIKAPSDPIFQLLFVAIAGSLIIKLYQSGAAKQLVSCGCKRGNVILGQFFSFTAAFSTVLFVSAAAAGAATLINGGAFFPADFHVARLLMALVGMVLSTASLSALFLLVAHLTGSVPATVFAGIGLLFGAPFALMTLPDFLKPELIGKFLLTNLQQSAVDMTASTMKQLSGMGLLVLAIAALLVLSQCVFNRKEVK
ncbi:MAG: hypothetical protein Q4B85_08905 [Lachnospiraceae bacterium]|nr:hypothetical protein [Lachnospiraceae bacterium]